MAKINLSARSLGSLPRFLLFLLCLLSTGALASVEITSTIVVPAPTQTASSSYTSDSEFRETVLNVTNRYRREHHADSLKWNKTLESAALDWAERCQWEHSQGPTGENLAMGYKNAEAAVKAWGDERILYNFDYPTGFTEETGHFTQLVWRGTKTVGCARVNCGIDSYYDFDSEEHDHDHDDDDDDDDYDEDDGPDYAQGWYVVCEYWPPGNVLGDERFRNNVLSSNSEDVFFGGAPGMESRCRVWVILGILFGMAVFL